MAWRKIFDKRTSVLSKTLFEIIQCKINFSQLVPWNFVVQNNMPINKYKIQDNKDYLFVLVAYIFSWLGDSISEDKVFSFINESFNKKEWNYNSCLTFVVGIITNWVK